MKKRKIRKRLAKACEQIAHGRYCSALWEIKYVIDKLSPDRPSGEPPSDLSYNTVLAYRNTIKGRGDS